MLFVAKKMMRFKADHLLQEKAILSVIYCCFSFTWKALFDGKKKVVVNNFETGEWSKKIYEELIGIQLGKKEDKFNWIVKIED